MRKSLVQCLVLTLVGLAAGFGFNAVSPHPLPVVPKAGQTVKGFRMVTTEEVKFYLQEEKSTRLVDARSREEYSLGHIPGALSVPEDDFEASFAKAKDPLAKARWVIVYCSGGSCATSEMVAEKLAAKGLPADRILIAGEGFPGWMRGKNPIESGLP